jgi:acyl carrier protein
MTMPDPLESARALIAVREDILDRLGALLIRDLHVQHEPDAMDPDTPLFATGLGLDSVDAVELVVCLEREFGVHLADDKEVLRKVRTLNSIVEAVLLTEESPHAS